MDKRPKHSFLDTIINKLKEIFEIKTGIEGIDIADLRKKFYNFAGEAGYERFIERFREYSLVKGKLSVLGRDFWIEFLKQEKLDPDIFSNVYLINDILNTDLEYRRKCQEEYRRKCQEKRHNLLKTTRSIALTILVLFLISLPAIIYLWIERQNEIEKEKQLVQSILSQKLLDPYINYLKEKPADKQEPLIKERLLELFKEKNNITLKIMGNCDDKLPIVRDVVSICHHRGIKDITIIIDIYGTPLSAIYKGRSNPLGFGNKLFTGVELSGEITILLNEKHSVSKRFYKKIEPPVSLSSSGGYDSPDEAPFRSAYDSFPQIFEEMLDELFGPEKSPALNGTLP